MTGLRPPGRQRARRVLADGWFRGQIGITRAHDQWGTETAFLGQLEVEHEDGSSTVSAPTRPGAGRTSHVTAADLIAGQHEDRRLRRRARDVGAGRDQSTAGTTRWSTRPRRRCARSRSSGRSSVDRAAARAPGRRPRPEHQRLGPAHRPRARRAPSSCSPTASALDADGDVTTDHLAPDVRSCPSRCRPARSTGSSRPACRATSSSRGTPPTASSTSASRATPARSTPTTSPASSCTPTCAAPAGSRCSDERINRLHEAAVWSFRGNACDVPTDCPHRERAGWTGDWQLFVPTAAFLYDVAGFSAKWLRDLARRPVGRRHGRQHRPDAGRPSGPASIAILNGSAGWGDAVVIVPVGAVPGVRRRRSARASCGRRWSRWVDRAERMAATERHPDRAAAAPSRGRTRSTSGTPASTGASGWSRARTPATSGASSPRDKGDVATAFYAWSTRHAGRGSPAARRATTRPSATPSWASTCVDAWRTEYLAADGRRRPGHPGQPASARWRSTSCPTSCGQRPPTARRADPGRRTPTSAPASWPRRTCCRCSPTTGHLDVAYELLFQDTAAVLAGHDRPRRDHGLGALGGHRRRRRRRTSR